MMAPPPPPLPPQHCCALYIDCDGLRQTPTQSLSFKNGLKL